MIVNNKINIYIGNGLFNESDLLFNEYLYERIWLRIHELELHHLKDCVEIYVPQFNQDINDKTKYADSKMIYDGDNERLDNTDILIAVIDGGDLGLGTEIGRFSLMCEKEPLKTILGLYSDTRQGNAIPEKINAINNEIGENQFSYINLYTVGAIKSVGKLYNNSSDLIDDLIENMNKIYKDKIESSQ